MKADAVMTVDVTSVTPETTLAKAHALMRELDVRHLPVVHGGRVVGLVSDRDLLARGVKKRGRLALPSGRVRRVMSRVTLTKGPAATISELAHLMIDEKIDAVPIVDAKRKLVGLVTSSDLLRLLTDVVRPKDRLPFSFTLRQL
jgi:acetoin utilization protein AcuB